MTTLVIGLKIIAAIVFLIFPYIFGLLPLWTIGKMTDRHHSRSQNWMSFANCATGGIFFAIGIVHLLREASSDLSNNLTDRIPIAELLFATGFFIIFYLEHVLIDHSHLHIETIDEQAESKPLIAKGNSNSTSTSNSNSSRRTLMSTVLTIVLSIHSIIGGLTLGIHQDTKTVIEIMVAILAHKWLEV